jgi:hypothetical protein
MTTWSVASTRAACRASSRDRTALSTGVAPRAQFPRQLAGRPLRGCFSRAEFGEVGSDHPELSWESRGSNRPSGKVPDWAVCIGASQRRFSWRRRDSKPRHPPWQLHGGCLVRLVRLASAPELHVLGVHNNVAVAVTPRTIEADRCAWRHVTRSNRLTARAVPPDRGRTDRCSVPRPRGIPLRRRSPGRRRACVRTRARRAGSP